MRFPFFRNRDSVKNGILISIRRTGDGFHPGLFREHGYGLKNVKKVLDKYISTLDFECSDERFTVKILMKI